MQATGARCWACGADAQHCLTIADRAPRSPGFMKALCAECRRLVVDLLSNIKKRSAS